MPRRQQTIGGNSQEIDPTAFLGSLGKSGGGGGGLKDLAALMEIAGVGPKGREQEVEAEKAKALMEYYQGNLANERAKQAAELGHYGQLEAIERDKMAQQGLKNRVDFVKDLMTSQYGNVPQELAFKELENLPEEYSAPLKAHREGLLQAAVEKNLPLVQAAYANKDPKKMQAALDVFFKNPATVGGREILNRMPWQELNQSLAQQQAEQPAAGGGYAGAVSQPWQEYKAPELPGYFEVKQPLVSPEQALPWQRPAAPLTGVNPALPWR